MSSYWIIWLYFLDFLCVGGWEQDIPYNMLPGVEADEDDINSYSSSIYDGGTGNRRVTEYGSSNYYTDQDEEEAVIFMLHQNLICV